MSIATFLDWADGAGYLLIKQALSLTWQSALVLGSALLLTWWFKRSGADARGWLLIAVIGLLPLLPLSSLVSDRLGAPQMEIRLLPDYQSRTVQTVSANSYRIVTPQRTNAVTPLVAPPPAPPARPAIDLWQHPWALGGTLLLLGSCVFLGNLLLGRLRLRDWRRTARSVTDPRLRATFAAAARRLEYRHDFELLTSGQVLTPLTFGIRRPVVLLPVDLTRSLAPGELESIALHELAHLKRRDPLLLTTVAVLRALLFFNPLLWLATQRLARLAEEACDNIVVNTTTDPVRYANLLTAIAETLPRRRLKMELSAGFLLTRKLFKRRIEAILTRRHDQRGWGRLRLTLTLALLSFSFLVAATTPIGSRLLPEWQERTVAIAGEDRAEPVRVKVMVTEEETAGPETHAVTVTLLENDNLLIDASRLAGCDSLLRKELTDQLLNSLVISGAEQGDMRTLILTCVDSLLTDAGDERMLRKLAISGAVDTTGLASFICVSEDSLPGFDAKTQVVKRIQISTAFEADAPHAMICTDIDSLLTADSGEWAIKKARGTSAVYDTGLQTLILSGVDSLVMIDSGEGIIKEMWITDDCDTLEWSTLLATECNSLPGAEGKEGLLREVWITDDCDPLELSLLALHDIDSLLMDENENLLIKKVLTTGTGEAGDSTCLFVTVTDDSLLLAEGLDLQLLAIDPALALTVEAGSDSTLCRQIEVIVKQVAAGVEVEASASASHVAAPAAVGVGTAAPAPPAVLEAVSPPPGGKMGADLERITTDMSEAELIGIFGQPDQILELEELADRALVWQRKFLLWPRETVVAVFKGDKLVMTTHSAGGLGQPVEEHIYEALSGKDDTSLPVLPDIPTVTASVEMGSDLRAMLAELAGCSGTSCTATDATAALFNVITLEMNYDQVATQLGEPTSKEKHSFGKVTHLWVQNGETIAVTFKQEGTQMLEKRFSADGVEITVDKGSWRARSTEGDQTIQLIVEE